MNPEKLVLRASLLAAIAFTIIVCFSGCGGGDVSDDQERIAPIPCDVRPELCR